MDQLDLIKRAINLRKPICFEYAVQGKVNGKRYSNQHAIFLHPTTDNLLVDIFQVSGVSDTKDKLPGWRKPLLSYISNITVLEDADCFDIANGYKPNSPYYARVISKV